MTAVRRRTIESLIEVQCEGAAIRESIAAARAERRAFVEQQVEIDLLLALVLGKALQTATIGRAPIAARGRAAAWRVRTWRAELGE